MKRTVARATLPLALLMTLSLGMAGCSEPSPSENGGNVAGSTSQGDGPLGIDTSSIFDDTISDDVLKAYPNEEYGTNAAIEETLETYDELNSISAFWGERDTTKDMELIESHKDKFHEATYEAIATEVEDYGQMQAFFVLGGQGILNETTEEGEIKEHKVSENKEPEQGFSLTSIELNEDKSAVVIKGTRTWKYFTDNGPEFKGTNDFAVTISPNDSKEWKIAEMKWSNLHSETV